jgi:serine/threonine protein kinase
MNPEKVHAGSLKYMAPELLIGHAESTAGIDVWSLGIILHGIVMGYVPFRSSSKDDLKKMIIEQEIKFPAKGAPKISVHCKDLIRKMLEKDPAKRITIGQIMLHPWISKYKDQKIKREWGYSDSDDSIIADEDDQESHITDTPSSTKEGTVIHKGEAISASPFGPDDSASLERSPD